VTPPVAKPRVRRPRSAVVLTISLLLLALVGAGCSGGGGDGGGDDDGRGGGGDRSGREVRLDARVAKVAGVLGKPRREKVAREAGAVVDRWFEAAYLGGDYPRSSFKDSWPGFTRDTRRQAVSDKRLTSNAGIGPKTESVVARRKQVLVDVLAWKGKQRAATARFTLVFDATVKRTARHKVTGRAVLVLDRKGRWRVVGYDVSRSHRILGGDDR